MEQLQTEKIKVKCVSNDIANFSRNKRKKNGTV
jgi:hypothetical protein